MLRKAALCFSNLHDNSVPQYPPTFTYSLRMGCHRYPRQLFLRLLETNAYNESP